MSTAASASRQMSSALFASSQFLAGRICLCGMIAIGAYIAGSRDWPLIWFVLMVASVLGQLSAAGRWRGADKIGEAALLRLRTALSLFDTTMYSLAAAVISQDHDGLAAPFGITLIMMTMLYVLMHFYMQPKLVILLNTPCFVGLLYCLGENGFNASAARNPLHLYLPFAGALFTLYFFYEARSHLAKARRALTKSRSEALARVIDAQAASQVKSEFLATMGHEIRTPLNGVLGIAQVMGADELSERQRGRLSVIQSSGESLLAILNDLLDISKIEAGKLELELVDFSLSEIAKGVHALFNAAASVKGIAFKLAIADSALGDYCGDPARLRQVLYNLVSNAVKFTHHGEVCVTIAYENDQLGIDVRDTGIGIPLDRQSGLFEKFVQADASTTRRYGGTGLGLAISNQLVTAMNGALSVSSTEGLGTLFTATIPLVKLASATPANACTEAEAPIRTAAVEEVLRVLVAEDNATNQLVIKLMLNQMGVSPAIVENGRAAVDASSSEDWDIILMDIQMPEMDGVAATREIRQRELSKGARRTPILALTANTMTHQAKEYMTVGMDGLISKPISAAELFTALETVLEKPEPSPEIRAA